MLKHYLEQGVSKTELSRRFMHRTISRSFKTTRSGISRRG